MIILLMALRYLFHHDISNNNPTMSIEASEVDLFQVRPHLAHTRLSLPSCVD